MSSPVDSFATAHSPSTTVPAAPLVNASPPAGSLVLAGIHWDEYLMLREKPENHHIRMTYKDGRLELMTLSSFHELVSLIIDHFILEWRVARDIAVTPTGSMTLKLKSTASGLEGDQSYYIQNHALVHGQRVIDLESSPPPDLVVEVEYSRSAISKMEIYRDLKVPEVWRWHDETLTIFRLVGGVYTRQAESDALPDFPFNLLLDALQQRHQTNETTLIKQFRQVLSTFTPKTPNREEKTD